MKHFVTLSRFGLHPGLFSRHPPKRGLSSSDLTLAGSRSNVMNIKLERATGFEPATASLEGWNSTTELRPLQFSQRCSLLEIRLALSHAPKRGCRIHGSSYHVTTNNLWWAGKDSNLGSRWQQIYSLPPLSTRVPAPSATQCFDSPLLNNDKEQGKRNGRIEYRHTPLSSCRARGKGYITFYLKRLWTIPKNSRLYSDVKKQSSNGMRRKTMERPFDLIHRLTDSGCRF